jgi:hypothetical protein
MNRVEVPPTKGDLALPILNDKRLNLGEIIKPFGTLKLKGITQAQIDKYGLTRTDPQSTTPYNVVSPFSNLRFI